MLITGSKLNRSEIVQLQTSEILDKVKGLGKLLPNSIKEICLCEIPRSSENFSCVRLSLFLYSLIL